MKLLLVMLLSLVLLFLVVRASNSCVDPRIFGGRDAEEAEFPYQVSIRFLNIHLCGGSLIDKKTVLTAAHCFNGVDKVKIIVGTNKVNGDGEECGSQRLIIHEEYSSLFKRNDVALVILDRMVQFNSKVQPIQLESRYVGSGVGSLLTGWGKYEKGSPENLQKIRLKTITIDECSSRLSNSGVTVYQTNVCTYTKPGEGACVADSGGPLVVNGKQIGVLSWGVSCARGHPDVYSRVSAYVDWINTHRHGAKRRK